MTIALEDVRATSLSEGWRRTLELVSETPDRRMFHVVTRISEPWREDPGTRAMADSLLSGLGYDGVPTVANTIFPARLAAKTADSEELVRRYRAMYPRIKKIHKDNRRGTYFGRLVAHPNGTNGDVDQLSALIRKVRAEHQNQAPKSARYELAIAGPTNDSLGDSEEDDESGIYTADTYAAGRDNSIMGFPCLSFCSVQLDRGRLHLVAHYRGQRLVQRGYGNYLGLARLQQYVADQAEVDPGALMIVAGRAEADATKRTIRRALEEVSVETASAPA